MIQIIKINTLPLKKLKRIDYIIILIILPSHVIIKLLFTFFLFAKHPFFATPDISNMRD